MKRILVWLSCLILVTMACGVTKSKTPQVPLNQPKIIMPTVISTVTQILTVTLAPTQENIIEKSNQPDFIQQWAIDAFSFFNASDPFQAAGEADEKTCGDNSHSWYPEKDFAEQTLELTLAQTVVPQKILIHFQGDPSMITKVEAINMENGLSVYSDIPFPGQPIADCPAVLDLELETEVSVDRLYIIVNGSYQNISIDAIEVIGIQMAVNGPPIYWRIGGKTGSEDNPFSIPMLMDLDSSGHLYIADGFRGVVVLDQEGNHINTFLPENSEQVVDVKVNPEGNLILADRGKQQIIVTQPDGIELFRFGEIGSDPGDFGWNSPRILAVHPIDGTIYVLDDNKDEIGDEFTRLQSYNGGTGEFIEEQRIPDIQPGGIYSMDINESGLLYIPNPVGGYIIQYDPVNQETTKLGEEALANSTPQVISLTPQGDMYVGVGWSEDGIPIRLLDALGNGYNKLGRTIEINDHHEGWQEGQFYDPRGITVDPMGMFLFISDDSGEYSYLTAYQLFDYEQ